MRCIAASGCAPGKTTARLARRAKLAEARTSVPAVAACLEQAREPVALREHGAQVPSSPSFRIWDPGSVKVLWCMVAFGQPGPVVGDRSVLVMVTPASRPRPGDTLQSLTRLNFVGAPGFSGGLVCIPFPSSPSICPTHPSRLAVVTVDAGGFSPPGAPTVWRSFGRASSLLGSSFRLRAPLC